jgi:hypothetical protein
MLEGLGRLFRGSVQLLVYPTRAVSGDLTTAENWNVQSEHRSLYAYFLQNRQIVAIRDFDGPQLHAMPGEVLLQSGDPACEHLVPAPATALIKERRLFGYRPRPMAVS